MRFFQERQRAPVHGWVVATVMTGTFMGGLDTYIVNVSLPTIAETFRAEVAMVQWVALAYLVVITSALVIAGRASDLWGSRRVYLGGLLTFVLGSALCGAAPTALSLVVFRGVQGLGAAMLLSSGQALLAEVFPEGQRGRVMAGLHVAVALGFTLGPAMGGLIVEAVGWRWVFAVNVPIGLIAALGRRWVAELDRHGVERAVLLGSIMDDEESVARAVQAFPDRLIGFLRVDPTRPDAALQIRYAVERLGLKGLKGFPAMECFYANEERVYPVYEEAQRLGIPVLFHFGLLQSAIGAALKLPSQADARFSNRMDLQKAARDFAGVSFIVPNFGAGYFRETMLLAAHCPNVFIDTSSANGWIRYMAYPMDLKLVFQRTLEAVGPERIIFGTDSSHFPRGFRRELLEAQVGILKALEVTREEAQLIMGGNIARLLQVDW